MGIAKIQGLGVLLLIGLGALVMFLVYAGLIDIRKDKLACFGGKHYFAATDRQRLFAIGSLNVYYIPMTYGCDSDHQYDQTVYRIENGQLVPR